MKTFTLETWLSKTFFSRVGRKRRFAWQAARRQAEFDPLVLTLVTMSSAAIITVGAWIAFGHGHTYSVLFLTIPANSLTIGILTVFLSYSNKLYSPLRSLSKLMLLASTGASAIERIQEVLDEPLEDPQSATRSYEQLEDRGRFDADLAAARRRRTARLDAREIHGDVSYRGVVFGYDAGRPVLQDVNLDVPTGKRVALVGLSGSGKTTLVRLLPRLYEPWAGTITIDGVDIGSYPRDTLRRHIGMVLQDSILFEGTIRENIVLNQEDVTEEQLVAASTQACIHDTIVAMPDGYESKVRELGKNFSSGQRQRIAIARAFLRNAPILILDEPTANLDVEAEAEVMRAVERLTAGRTVIVISHRLSTLGHVDEIVVLSAGLVVESGTYQELKAYGGDFAHLLAEQNRYAAEPVLLPVDVDGNGRYASRAIDKAGVDGKT